jgi:hypothetical protein
MCPFSNIDEIRKSIGCGSKDLMAVWRSCQ